jgi:gluconate 5-dehydrogenase
VGRARHHGERDLPGVLSIEDDQHDARRDREDRARRTPTGRLGNEEDLKGLAVLLASEAGRHITGQAIAVDGGASVI